MTASPASAGVIAGFYGKLPARGDFVRAGLPRDFTDKWDDWLQSVIAGSRDLMGEAWLPAFLEAPVWRFALSAGLCGEHAAYGLFMPSVDKAGRYFPLTFAALHSGSVDAADTASASAWLDRCEAAGFEALEADAPPERISAMLGSPDAPDSAGGAVRSVWWSAGSPRVVPQRMVLSGMPDSTTFATMLQSAEGPGEVVGENRWEPTP